MAESQGLTDWQRFARNRLALVGLGLVTVLVVLAGAAPILPLADPNATALDRRLLPPLSPEHWLGTDHLGRDLLSRLIWGTRASLAVGLTATALAVSIGALIGLIAGYRGGWLDSLLMRGIDVLLAFPYLLLALAIVAALGPGLLNALLAVAIVNIPFFARTVRGLTVGLTQREFVAAARLSGLSGPRILLGEILPNVLPTVVVAAATTLGWMILETAGLSFLGLGAQPPKADLGSMLGEGRDLLLTAPHVSVIPGLVILLLVMGVNLLGDGLRDLLDPRLSRGALAAPGAMTRVERSEAPSPPAEAGADTPLLTVRDLTLHLAGQTQPVVQDLSFTLNRGECLGLVGESGSGKTLSALALLRLAPSPPAIVTAGSVRLSGDELLDLPPRRLQALRGARVGYVFQDPQGSLNPLLTVGEQITETLRAHGALSRRAARSRAAELLEQVDIPEPRRRLDSYPPTLSGGQRQRVMIAMALANDPELLICDEPSTALDVTTQARLLRLLDRLRRERGMAMLFITHDFGIVSELCHRVLVLYAGQVVESGDVAELFADPRHPYTRRLMTCVPRLGRKDQPLTAIPGQPPGPDRRPRGCAFAPRCPLAVENCRAGPVPLETFYTHRAVRCLRAWDDEF